MASWHRPGQMIVALRDLGAGQGPRRFMFFPGKRFGALVRKGEIYCIASVNDGFGVSFDPGLDADEAWLRLKGVHWHCGAKVWWGSKYFRPVRTTSIEQFRVLLNPSPNIVRELTDAEP